MIRFELICVAVALVFGGCSNFLFMLADRNRRIDFVGETSLGDPRVAELTGEGIDPMLQRRGPLRKKNFNPFGLRCWRLAVICLAIFALSLTLFFVSTWIHNLKAFDQPRGTGIAYHWTNWVPLIAAIVMAVATLSRRLRRPRG